MICLRPRDRNHVLSEFRLRGTTPTWCGPIARALLFVLLLASLAEAQSNERKRVLLLMQEDLSWPIFRLIDENVRVTLGHGSPEGILIFSEHMDRIHFPDPKIQAQRQAWVQRKYADSKLDLVIEVGDFPRDLFPNVPLVYASLNPQRTAPSRLRTPENDASIWLQIGARNTLEASKRFQPNAKQIVVIAGTSPTEKILLDQTREQIASYSSGLQANYLTNLGFSEICNRVRALGPESIVLFVSLARDGDGRPFIPAEAISKIASASGAPVYALFDTLIGSGALGGYVTRFGELGKQAGEIGLQILAGEHPPNSLARSDYVFDWRQLQRWKIPESALPVGSIVINRQLTMWERYRWYIVALLVCVVETLLIFGLLWQWAKKRKFRRSFFNQMAFDKMLAELSTVFINLPEERVDSVIERSLGPIAALLKLDRITLFDIVRSAQQLKVAGSWSGQGVPSLPGEVKLDKFPVLRDQILKGKMVLIPDVSALPTEAKEERMSFAELGTTSLAVLPLKAGDELFGVISFASTKRPMVWAGELVERLKLLAETFSNAMMRKRARNMQSRHAAIIECSDDAIISTNLDGIILSWNAGAQRMFGFTEDEIVAHPITILIPQELHHEEDEILQRIRAGKSVEHYETTRVTREGQRLAVSLKVSPIRDSAGTVMGASKIARDITQRKRAEQVLRESEDRFRLVANSAPALIWMADKDKQCTFFNQGWLSFTGRSMEEELGAGWTSGVHPDDLKRCLALYSSSFDARVEFQMEYRLRRFDGEYRWVVDFGVPRFESDATFRGYIGSCVDITDRKCAEESLHSLTGRLITAQEEERARIARELHDDFSQRLALISIGLGQLWKRLPKSEIEERASVQEMLEGAKEMSLDIHSLSHQLHSSKLEHVGLVPALNGLCKEIGQKYKLDIHFSHYQVPSDISKDVALCLFRVAQEALGNVVKHSGTQEAQVELQADPAVVTLRISDHGRGFNPRVQNSAAGIGMIGMNERLRLVGGKLLVKSEPKRGTEILAEVPLAVAANDTQHRAQTAGR
jgi:PAS domain S-box-containing protein